MATSYIKISKIFEQANLQYSNEDLLYYLGELCNDDYDVCILDINCMNIYGKDNHQNWEVSFIEDSNSYYQDFTSYIDYEYDRKKHIVISLELDLYAVTVNKVTKVNEEISHRACLFLKYTDNGYEMYYINGHGNDIIDYIEYQMYITRKRMKYIPSNGKCVDYDIINLLLNELQKCESTNIIFKFNTKHVYSGQNLQEYDNYGLCYIIPFIVLVTLRQRHRFCVNLNITSIIEHVVGKLIWVSENENSMLKKGEVIENKQYTPHISKQFDILNTIALSHLLIKIMSFVYLGKTDEYDNEL